MKLYLKKKIVCVGGFISTFPDQSVQMMLAIWDESYFKLVFKLIQFS